MFIHEDFLLETQEACKLYHDYAAKMPIIDFHCHLSPSEIARDISFENLTQAWLYGDHYKWRAMRSNGVEERYCTGNASDREKFDKWAETVPATLRNPLYHWTHLELKNYFGISDRLLGPDTAESIWNESAALLSTDDFSTRNLIRNSKVECLCTTDDPLDTLEFHRQIATDLSFPVMVLPTWRPDRGRKIDDLASFNEWVNRLAEISSCNISDYATYVDALEKRHTFFHVNGCRLSDHDLDFIFYEDYRDDDIHRTFKKARRGEAINSRENAQFQTAMMHVFGHMDARRSWTQQYHIGAQRNNNTRMLRQVGPDSGFDSIGNTSVARSLARLLDSLDIKGELPKTILYNLNPSDNEVLATMLGNFQDGSVPGKMQLGSGWWFLDQQRGMEHQMEALSLMGLLSHFVGMVTDSRSFLSYPRHEYFRRVLCNMLGNDLHKGLIPRDFTMVGEMIQNISYYNARRYFGFFEEK